FEFDKLCSRYCPRRWSASVGTPMLVAILRKSGSWRIACQARMAIFAQSTVFPEPQSSIEIRRNRWTSLSGRALPDRAEQPRSLQNQGADSFGIGACEQQAD